MLPVISIIYIVGLGLYVVGCVIVVARTLTVSGWGLSATKNFYGFAGFQTLFAMLTQVYLARLETEEVATIMPQFAVLHAISYFCYVMMSISLLAHWRALLTTAPTFKYYWKLVLGLAFALAVWVFAFIIFVITRPPSYWNSGDFLVGLTFYNVNTYLEGFVWVVLAIRFFSYGVRVAAVSIQNRVEAGGSITCQGTEAQIFVLFGMSGLCMLSRTVILFVSFNCTIANKMYVCPTFTSFAVKILFDYVIPETLPSLTMYWNMLPKSVLDWKDDEDEYVTETPYDERYELGNVHANAVDYRAMTDVDDTGTRKGRTVTGFDIEPVRRTGPVITNISTSAAFGSLDNEQEQMCVMIPHNDSVYDRDSSRTPVVLGEGVFAAEDKEAKAKHKAALAVSRVVLKEYEFPATITNSETVALKVTEELAASDFTFGPSLQLVRLRAQRAEVAAEQFVVRWERSLHRWSAIARQNKADTGLTGLMGALEDQTRASEHIAWFDAVEKSFSRHIFDLNSLIHISSRDDGRIFKKSTEKKIAELACIPTNLHVQRLIVEPMEGGMSGGESRVHSVITVGAPAAHVLSFRNDGIRQLLARRTQLLSRVGDDCSEYATTLTMMAVEECEFELMQRMDVAYPQALSIFVSLFVEHLQLYLASPEVLDRYATLGFLMCSSSLLSTSGDETGMIGDMDGAMKWLSTVLVHVSGREGLQQPEAKVNRASPSDELVGRANLEALYPSTIVSFNSSTQEISHTVRARPSHVNPSPLSEQGDFSTEMNNGGVPKMARTIEAWLEMWSEPIPSGVTVEIELPMQMFNMLPPVYHKYHRVKVCPVFFTQGINETQTVSNKLALNTSLQSEVNDESFRALVHYYKAYKLHVLKPVSRGDLTSMRLLPQLDKLAQALRVELTKQKTANDKNTNVITLSADITRLLEGGRTMSCKSAKDRTSMGVTYEFARLLSQEYDVKESEVMNVAQEFRTVGVRRENVRRNIGKPVYAFNALQVHSLPEIYQPPPGTAGNARG